ncbi:uncharacterized protein LOC141879914 isoform X2 [Acropora palmata]|uniref:uncharacterized protein LOC141879914 isoform X2 n=1 Tax=Acropora palmata TaxID=6131 RepID=UPI003D9FE15A
MEPFIQLNSSKKCPRKYSTSKVTSLVDKKKVSELFWIDLLEAKCAEGLGEVSENLLNDQNLTSEDFFDNQHISERDNTLHVQDNHAGSSNFLTNRKTDNRQEFKTPDASKRFQKIIETPCLFSQDESGSIFPSSGLPDCEHKRTDSQLTCDVKTRALQGSPISFRFLFTPATLHSHSSADDWHNKASKTPDALAEIMRIARVLFSGSASNKSAELLDLSLDDAMTSCQVLDPLKSIDVDRETIQQEEDEEDACVNDEFILENSCYCSSKFEDDDQPDNVATDSVKTSQSVIEFENTKAGSILKTASISLDRTLRPMESEPLFDPSLSNLPLSGNFQSPSSRTPPKALAQSTPKPTPSRVVEKELGGLMDTKDSGTSICKTYDSRKSEPGSSLSPDSPLPDLVFSGVTEVEVAINDITENTVSTQLKQGPETTKKTPNEEIRETEITRIPVKEATESKPDVAMSCAKVIKKHSFFKTPVLRRSLGTKRSYQPSPIHEDITKRFKAERTIVVTNGNSVNSKSKEGASYDDGETIHVEMAICNENCFEEGSSGSKGEKEGKRCKERNKWEKKGYDGVLFDMDSLSQFPIDCVLSPPSLKCSSVFPDVNSSLSVEQHNVNVANKAPKKEIQRNVETDELLSDFCEDDKTAKKETFSPEEKDTFGEPLSFSEKNRNPLPPNSTQVNPPSEGENTVVTLANYVIGPQGISKECDPGIEKFVKSFLCQECDPSKVDLYSIFSQQGETNGSRTGRTGTVGVSGIQNKSVTLEINGFDRSKASKVSKLSMDMGNNDYISEFVGFHTASGKRVSVSSDALQKAKVAIEEMEVSFGPNEVSSNGQVQHPGEEIRMSDHSIKQACKSDVDFQINRNCQDRTEYEGQPEKSESITTVEDKLADAISERHKVPVNLCEKDMASFMAGSKFKVKTNHDLESKQSEKLARPGTNLDRKVRTSVHTACCDSHTNDDTAFLNTSDVERKARAVDDSLLEDLLNDCKRKRRDSLEVIMNKRDEGMSEFFEEGQRANPGAEVDVFSTVVYELEGLERTDEVATGKQFNDLSFKNGCDSVSKTEKTVNDENISKQEDGNDYQSISLRKGLRTASRKVSKVPGDSAHWARGALKMIDGKRFDDGKSNLQSSNAESEEESLTLKGIWKVCETESADSQPKKVSNSFAGFQTAGGRKVSISEESLKAGQDIMRRLTEDVSSLSCVDVSRFDSEKTLSLPKGPSEADALGRGEGKSIKLTDGATEIDSVFAECLNADVNYLNPERFGFQTASGKRVILSNEALKRGGVIMDQIDKSLHAQSEEEMASSLSSSSHFCGFQTAAGRSVETSKGSVDGGESILREIEKSPSGGIPQETISVAKCVVAGLNNEIEERVSVHQQSFGKRKAIMPLVKKKHATESQKNAPSPSSGPGFQTAAGRSVEMSKESLQKGAALMEQIDKSLNLSNVGGFTVCATGSQRSSEQNVKPAKNSWTVGLELEEREEVRSTNSCSASAFEGFRTANGSLLKGAAILQQIDASLSETKENGRSGLCEATCVVKFQSERDQSLKLWKVPLKEEKQMVEQTDNSLCKEENGSDSCNSAGFLGFQTAGGRHVRLSRESILKGAALMKQVDESLEKNETSFDSEPCAVTGATIFQTAAGNCVKLSKESLAKGTAIMKQIDISLQETFDSCSASGIGSFQTARSQSVKLSRESLEKGATIVGGIGNISSCRDSKERVTSNSIFPGFKTARGHSVNLSEESLSKGAEIMRQIDSRLMESKGKDDSVSCSATSFTRFPITCNQSVKPPTESSPPKEARFEHYTDTSLVNADNYLSPTFSGFQTASGRTVNISESALAKGKEILADTDRQINSLSVSNETMDSGWHTDVSKVKSSFGVSEAVVQERQVHGKNTQVLLEGDRGELTFEGFFTAGGFKVSVSEQALGIARKLLLETNNNLDGSRREQGTPLRETASPLAYMEIRGRTTPDPETNKNDSGDDKVSREILESSKALMADESFMHVTEYLPGKLERSDTRIASFSLERQISRYHPDAASVSKSALPRRHSTPLHCSEEVVSSKPVLTRNVMKPCTTTPSGILHDRRLRSFHIPLRPRQSSFEQTYGLDSTSPTSNRKLKPLQALTPGCLQAKKDSLPRTSTPVNPIASRRGTHSPRPPFVTPYRRQQTCKDVSPLALCNTSASLPVGEPSEGGLVATAEPSPKKPRLSGASNCAFNTTSTPGGGHKTDTRTKPQPGFLSQVRRRGQRTRLKEFIGNALPGGFSVDELKKLGVPQELLSVTSSNAASFQFIASRYFSDSALHSKEGVRTEDGGILHIEENGKIGLEDIQRALFSTPGVDKDLISEEWVTNHYKWLVWKLAAMEVSFPSHFAGRCLTPDWVLCQLKYRYDREVDNSNRSALKKVMERDDVASRTMVLCVSNVSLSNDKLTENHVPEESTNQRDNGDKKLAKKNTELVSCAVIELTDGWYSIRGLLDKPLTRLLKDKRLVVGQKLCIYGAELVGSDQAVSPLEAPSSLMLRLHANSTRRARWDAKLGFHRRTRAFPLPLATLFGDGGFTGCVDVIVLRQYPVQWMEKMPDGSNIFRNSRLEEREAKRFEEDCQRRREKLFIKIQEEFEKEIGQPERRRSARFRRRSFPWNDVKALNDGKEIYEALTQFSDPEALKEYLDERQIRALEVYQQLMQEKKCGELQSKFERVWKEQTEEGQLQRNVVPLLKVRITDYSRKSQEKQNALLSIWRPSEEIMQLLNEGSRLRIYHLSSAGVRIRHGRSELQLSASRSTRYEALRSDRDVLRDSYLPRQTCSFHDLRHRGLSLQYSEVDIVGLVVFCSPLSSFSSSSSSLQTVYLSDEENNLVAVKFWGGLKVFAVDDLIKPRCFICCSNLTVLPEDHLSQCPSLTFSELSSLTQKPREIHLRNALQNLQKNIPNLDEFMTGIQEALASVLRPQRSSQHADVQVNTVRMYGKSKYMAPTCCVHKCTSSNSLTVQLEYANKENYSTCDDTNANSTEDTVCNNKQGQTQRPLASNCESQSALTMPGSYSNRQAKHKLLDHIADPPPLAPLPSPIPASVRREFQRPKRGGSSVKLPLEQ